MDETADKKKKKQQAVAKSMVILDVKPLGADTNMKELERDIRSIKMDGLIWGEGKLVPVGCGIQKLLIFMTIEDGKVSVDDLVVRIKTSLGEHVQSVDVIHGQEALAKLSGELNAAIHRIKEMADKKDLGEVTRATTAAKIYKELMEELESKLYGEAQGAKV